MRVYKVSARSFNTVHRMSLLSLMRAPLLAASLLAPWSPRGSLRLCADFSTSRSTFSEEEETFHHGAAARREALHAELSVRGLSAAELDNLLTSADYRGSAAFRTYAPTEPSQTQCGAPPQWPLSAPL